MTEKHMTSDVQRNRHQQQGKLRKMEKNVARTGFLELYGSPFWEGSKTATYTGGGLGRSPSPYKKSQIIRETVNFEGGVENTGAL